MTQIKHASQPHIVSVDLVNTLIKQMTTTPMPRVRDAARRQLYSVGGQIHEISKAIEHDLESGDNLLNQRTDEDQSIAPETTMWLEWLTMYQTAQTQLQRITEAIAGLDNQETEAA